jgi:prepilin-type N-terminal cleavage/methylation domain-containing protein
MKHSNKRSGFTLIELLVVITIIGLLLALSSPGITKVLTQARQTADVANARQLGVVLFGIANDEGGVYPVAGRDSNGVRIPTAVSSSSDLFNALVQDKDLTDVKILATNGKNPYRGSLTSPNLTEVNVGWDIIGGQTTSSDSNIPLILSTGAYTDVSGLTATTIPDVSPSTTNVWGNKGVAVYTVGNSAFFQPARTGGKIDALVSTAPSGNFLQP